jgi:hypothetical protein
MESAGQRRAECRVVERAPGRPRGRLLARGTKLGPALGAADRAYRRVLSWLVRVNGDVGERRTRPDGRESHWDPPARRPF